MGIWAADLVGVGDSPSGGVWAAVLFGVRVGPQFERGCGGGSAPYLILKWRLSLSRGGRQFERGCGGAADPHI